jgi:hypothetical protein
MSDADADTAEDLIARLSGASLPPIVTPSAKAAEAALVSSAQCWGRARSMRQRERNGAIDLPHQRVQFREHDRQCVEQADGLLLLRQVQVTLHPVAA